MPGTFRSREKESYYLKVFVNNKRYQKTVHCSSDAQAKKELSKFYTACEAGEIKTGNISINDLYMKDYVRLSLKTSTQRLIEHTIEKHISSNLRKKSKIKRRDVQLRVNDLSKELAPKTVKNYYSVLSGLFKWDQKMEYISHTPCEFINLPKRKTKEAKHLKQDNISRLLTALEVVDPQYKAIMYIAMIAGFRKGEILGLKRTHSKQKCQNAQASLLKRY